jgi:hypothetical protein
MKRSSREAAVAAALLAVRERVRIYERRRRPTLLLYGAPEGKLHYAFTNNYTHNVPFLSAVAVSSADFQSRGVPDNSVSLQSVPDVSAAAPEHHASIARITAALRQPPPPGCAWAFQNPASPQKWSLAVVVGPHTPPYYIYYGAIQMMKKLLPLTHSHYIMCPPLCADTWSSTLAQAFLAALQDTAPSRHDALGNDRFAFCAAAGLHQKS